MLRMRAASHGAGASSAADSAAGTADPTMVPGATKVFNEVKKRENHDEFIDPQIAARLGDVQEAGVQPKTTELDAMEANFQAPGGALGVPPAVLVRRAVSGPCPETQEEKFDARSRRMPPNAPKQAKQQQQHVPKAAVDEDFVNRVVNQAVAEVYESVKVETSTWQTSIMHLTDAVAKLTKRLEIFEVKVEDTNRLDGNYAKLATRIVALEEEALRSDCRSPKGVAGACGAGADNMSNTVEQLAQLTAIVTALEENVSFLRQSAGKMRSELQESADERSDIRRQLDDLRSQAGGLESRVAEATRSLASAAASAAAEAGAAAEAAAAAAASTQVDASGYNSVGDGGSLTTAVGSTTNDCASITEVAQHVAQLRQELQAERAERARAMQATVDRVEAMWRHGHDLRTDRSANVGPGPVSLGGYPVGPLDPPPVLKVAVPGTASVPSTRTNQASAMSPASTTGGAVPVVHATPAASVGGVMTPGKGGDRSHSVQRAVSPVVAAVVATESSRHVASPVRVRPPRAASPVLESGSLHVRSMSPVLPLRETAPLNTGGSVRTLASARDVVRSPTLPASLSMSWKASRAASSVNGWVSPVGTPPAPPPSGVGARGTSPTGLRVPTSFGGSVAFASPAAQPHERSHPPKVKAPPPLLAGSMAQPLSMRATMPARMQHLSLMNKEALAMVAQHQLAAQPQ